MDRTVIVDLNMRIGDVSQDSCKILDIEYLTFGRILFVFIETHIVPSDASFF